MEQLHLDLDQAGPLTMDAREIDPVAALSTADLQRAAVGWMLANKVIGVGLRVPTRIARFRADVAGFWNTTRRNTHWEGPGRLLVPCRTILVETRRRRADCWPDCGNSAELLPRLRALKQERRDLEAHLRATEPELRATDTLFEQYSEWNYEATRNPAYRQVRREIDKVEHALYSGTRFEAIRHAGLADYLYLAVPEKTVHPHEIADGWGLLWVGANLDVRVVAPAEDRQAVPENRFHLVQNIAAANLSQVGFALGIQATRGETTFLPPPRRRRARKS